MSAVRRMISIDLGSGRFNFHPARLRRRLLQSDAGPAHIPHREAVR